MHSKIKLIRSSTMKCLLNKKVKNNFFNNSNIWNTIYSRDENEWNLYMLDDFSIDKLTEHKRDKKNYKWHRFKSPIIVRRDLTYLCNFQCIHCYSDCSYEKKQYLPLDKVKKIIDVLDSNKVQFVQILWWEPLVYPKIIDVIEYALTKKFIFCINSNGYLLNDNIIKKFKQSWLKYIQISLNGLETEHNKLTRVKDSFKKASENIEKLIKTWINVSISCVVSDLNKNNIFDFLDFLIKIKVKNIQLLTPLRQWRAKENKFFLKNTDYKILKEKLITFKNRNIDINLDLPWFDIDVIDGVINKNKNNENYEFIFWCVWWVSGLRIDPLWNACICVWSAWEPIANLLTEPMDIIMKKLHKWRLKNICKMCKDCSSYLKDCQWACYLRFK